MNKTKTLLLLGALLLGGCGSSEKNNIPVSFWDWQPSIPLSKSNVFFLKEGGVGPTFLKMGMISADHQMPVIQRELLSKTLKSYAGLPIYLCYRMDQQFIDEFMDMEPVKTGTILSDQFSESLRSLTQLGYQVRGIQLDFDCPTRLLPAYTKMAETIHAKIRGIGPYSFSITTLDSWLYTWSFHQLVKNVDFYVPLMFGYDIPKEINNIPTLSSFTRVRWALLLANFYPKKYYVGIPTYTVCMFFDDQGSLVSLESNLSLNELMTGRNLKYLGSSKAPRTFNLRHVFSVEEDVYFNGLLLKKGWKIVSEETTGAQLRQLAKTVEKYADQKCEGLICYRLEKTVTDDSLSPEGVYEAVKNPNDVDQFGLSIGPIHWKGDQAVFTANFMNGNPFPNLTESRPIVLNVRIEGGQFLGVSPGTFDHYQFGFGFEENFRPASPLRANNVRFFKSRVLPLSSLNSGTITVKRLNNDFKICLYGTMVSSLTFEKVICKDFETAPDTAVPQYRREILPP